MMSALFVGATGMRGYSQGMQVISNNLANTNTVGFKSAMMMYEDLTSQSVQAPSNFQTNISQRGGGLGINSTRVSHFDQGSFEVGSTVTDLGINGMGYFGVVKDGQTYYTRAGNFRFNKEGELLDPSGYNLLGRRIVDGVTQGSSEPIKLDLNENSALLQSAAKATSSLKLISNLGGVGDMSQDASNEFFAMTSKWDGTSSPALPGGQYGYSEPVTVYDDQGNAHNLTMHYDFVGKKNGVSVYEYTLGMNPSEDGSANAGTKAAGLLMSGTVSFSSSGALIGMTAFTPTGQDPADLSAWQQANVVNGLPVCTATFAGAGAQQISLNLGATLDQGLNSGITSPEQGATDPDLFYAAMSGVTIEKNSTTSHGDSPASRLQEQDGYPVGELSDLKISEKGVVTARYNNGQSEDLYQITLYRFINRDGLRHEGGNHYSATEESGEATEGLPTEENFGSLMVQHIETSNVDMAKEFAQMIMTQRAFQMNSKVVTTSDQMLQKANELKR
ncbi:flagellar hook-basal body complex protein [Desulfovibrio sp. OttesenSCG-928-C14]|nr:flagellar hook-basal body complex protein [Desulfovibrio sp. OttesenSCG-928-C14]